jgi:hypothetical protein
MKKFLDIELFRSAVHNVKSESDFVGFEADGVSPVYAHTKPYPVIKFTGTVKIHGSNAAVVKHKEFSTERDENGFYKNKITFQSRDRELSLDKDNYGFMLNLAGKNLDALFEGIAFEDCICNSDVIHGRHKMNLYSRMRKRIAKKKLGNAWKDPRMIAGCKMKPGDLIGTCKGWNEIIETITPERYQSPHTRGTIVFDFDIWTTAQSSHSMRNCCCLPETKQEIIDYWMSHVDPRYQADHILWYGGEKRYFDSFTYKMCQAIKAGEEVFDERGMITPNWDRYKKYWVGCKLKHKESGVLGEVVKNFKLPGDICVSWESGLSTSYDEKVLDETCEIIYERFNL